MDDQDKIISFLKFTGPVIPAQVAKNINTSILLASAHLSELSSQGKVKISKIKIGGSPLYYLPEQREKLQNFIHHLNPKDQETFHQLKEKKILREKNLDLLTRVSLRAIKDFAQPLNLNINQNKELFWRWYLLTDDQAIALIRSQLQSPPPASPEPKNLPEPKPLPRPEVDPQPEKKEETPPPLLQNIPPLFQDPFSSPKEPSEEKRPSPEELPPTFAKEKPKKHLFQKIKERISPKRKEIKDEFFPQVDAFFQDKNIRIETKETVRKNAEINFIVKVPSVVGRLTYFCKAKNKKRCDERDLSTAYMEAQTKKLPLLFIYTTEISKKAKEMIDSNTFENLIIKKLG